MSKPRRSLILAGGGLKVAFQAGVLQAWLDEAGLEFDHVDGASGGVFNLAMMCQGMSGTQIADNWRDLPVWQGIGLNWRSYWRLLWAESLLDYRRWRKNIFPHWSIDFGLIQSSSLNASFNYYDFTDHRLVVCKPAELDEDKLIACVSLPMWFPPVRKDGHVLIDAVYRTDANLIEAVNQGADELWIIWTVSERAEWRDGFIANYFQIIETSANGLFRADLERIEANNRVIADGGLGEFGRTITIKQLRAEVPLHYLLNFKSSAFTRAVELGLEAGRDWCEQEGISLGGS